MRDVRVSDVTMRQAEVSGSLALTFKEKLETAKLLDSLGVSSIEIEGVERSKADALRIKSIASIVKNSVLAVPVKMDDENIQVVWGALKNAAFPRLQVVAAVSPARMEYVYHKKADGMMKDVAATIAKCAALTDDVEFVADDATRADSVYLRSVIKEAIQAGAKTITVCDDAGTMLPEEFAQFIDDLRKDLPELADVALGISCSNDLFMADACAIAGIMSGVDEIKATTYPMNVISLEKVCKVLAAKPEICQAQTTVRVTELKRTAAQVARICEQGRSKYSAFNPNVTGSDESFVLTVNDDIDAVMECVAKLGYELSEEDATNVYEAFLRIASKKDSVSNLELDAIVASAALQVPATYVLENYVINSGNAIKATANVRMRKGDEVLEAVCIGDGPIDASFLAIEKISGKRYELDDWQMQSVTEGQEAMGQAIVKLVADGKIYSGRGISTDIVGSSIRAYVNALNKIVYEEEN
ncbi:2-isopropylmalate synthase [Slackia heliotrinireducens]|uniref:2-isopropylmalate synthase n=1 Tax=Slackia heliotrinireducens (strain ATCC 29202 / DSM 20476 / NCTC 11029 / RHS 1) TaxID=471855 RepID=C7N750_SLAHD|nr:alpha-isopropylmalate synthase regulatory domain-containing protein [Slackia heliotrinireducens]ACV22735.1 isopropylmalate/homocitrate/citramalate synthase [Slackia heliotrinireducens DSM 20476]VEH01376.1 2-isopropylmalate synthase [Slackia heliotrinireducens]